MAVTFSQSSSIQKTLNKPLKEGLSFFLPYVLRYKFVLGFAFFALIGAGLITLCLPLAIRFMIDEGFQGRDEAFVNQAFLILLGLAFCLALMSTARFFFVTWLGERIMRDVRIDLFAHLLRLEMGFYSTMRAGDLVSSMSADTTLIKTAFSTNLSIALRNCILGVGAVFMMVYTSPRLALIVLIALPLIVLPLVGFGRVVKKYSRLAQDRLADLSAMSTEALGLVPLIRSFVGEKRLSAHFEGFAEHSFLAAKRALSARAFLIFFAILCVFSSIIFVLWIGAHDVISGKVSAGMLSQFVLYSLFAAGALGELSSVWGDVAQASGAASRLHDLMIRPREFSRSVTHNTERKSSKTLSGNLNVNALTFAYNDDQPVLKDISLQVKSGQVVALVGPSGAGKSTLFSLFLRFYDPQKGVIMLNDRPLDQISLDQLRHSFSVVSQSSPLFSWSVMENIRFARPDASDREVYDAARIAHAYDFIEALPDGFDTLLGEGGVRLSGGQKQRVAIARAVLKNAPFLLLDEATNALDAESEHDVQKALSTFMKGRTTFVIAHRLATVKDADYIYVLDEGCLVEEGTHDALVKNEGLYARLVKLQFQQENVL